MTNADAHSVPASAATWPRPPEPRKPKSESEFLQQQADWARGALAQVLDETKATGKELADPRLWTRRYPLPAVGVAFALGFLIAPKGHRRGRARDYDEEYTGNGHRRNGQRPKLTDTIRESLEGLLGGGALATLIKRLLGRQARSLLRSAMEMSAGAGRFADEERQDNPAGEELGHS